MTKTYTQTIEKPRLVIEYDSYGSSPREWDNLGYFITRQRNCSSPDKHPELEQCMMEARDMSTSAEQHAETIQEIYAGDEKILAVYPISKYEHGNIVYSRGVSEGWDSGVCGFYVVTQESVDVLGTPPEAFERVIDGELEEYTQWANGEVYCFTLYDENGGVEDSCGGFYALDDIKDHLPDEYKNDDLYQYLNNE